MIPKSKVHAVDIKVDDALQFVLSAGVSSGKKSGVEQT